jgi:DAK2 domain fusion protein YloV
VHEIDINILKNSILAASNNLAINKTEVNNLNVFPVPDGDTGTNMNMTIKSAIKVANESNAETIKEYMENYSKGSLLGARGNSGVILSQLIRGFVEAIPAKEPSLKVSDLTRCLVRSSEVAYNAVMKPTEGTILTVAKDIAKASKKFPKNNKNILEFLDFVYKEGEKSLARTPDLLPILKESGVVDAGGKGLLCIFEGVLKYLHGDNNILNTDFFDETSETITSEKNSFKDENIEFGYCTEFILNIDKNKKLDNIELELKNHYSKMGDSIMVVTSADVVKVHFHTNNPGAGLEKALEYGVLSDIKIDNMRIQHNELMFSPEEYDKTREENHAHDPIEEKPYYQNAFITVSSGDGFDEIFQSLNVAKIVSGGQTMNPSTENLLSAVNEINGKNIFILPNNSNIILAAEQVKSLSEKNVFVIPTKSMPEGITAIFSSMNEEDPNNVVSNAAEAISMMRTGEVTFAIRGTTFNGEDIDEGDIIGITEKNIISKGQDVASVSKKLIEHMRTDDYTLLSIYYGKDTPEDEAEMLKEELEKSYPDMDIELTYGGQPLYYYIISVE